jgi:hypothetical protein
MFSRQGIHESVTCPSIYRVNYNPAIKDFHQL